MARKRMFSQDVIASDAFLSLSVQAQCLYFHLNLYADDEGFVQNPKMIMRILDSPQANLEELEQSGYILRFPSGVVLIVHWFIHNDIRKDRLRATVCLKERSKVTLESRSYSFCECGIDDAPISQTDSVKEATSGMDAAQYRLDENSIDKGSIEQYITLPLRNGSEYVISPEKLEYWHQIYPNIPIESCFSDMRNWLTANTSKQRDASKMDALINTWLTNAQNSHERSNTNNGTAQSASAPALQHGTVL